MTLQEIEARKSELLQKVAEAKSQEEMAELRKEVEAINKEVPEERNATEVVAEEVANLEERNVTTNIEERKEEKEMELNKDNVLESTEYRSAYFKKMLGKALNESEERAYALAGVEGALPVETQNSIIEKAKKIAPMLNEVTLLNVPGAVKFAVEGVTNPAQIHKELEAITPDADTLISVTLNGYEITKLVQISQSVETMTAAGFETFLVDSLAESIARKVEDLIFNGTGKDEAEGILVNSDVIAQTTSSVTADNVRTLVAALNAGYDNGAKVYTSKAVLFNSLMGLQDNAKHDLIREINGKFYMYGYEIVTSDYITNAIVLGNAKKYVANLAQKQNVVKQFDINTNSYKYLGAAIFDGKVSIGEAFVKLTINAGV